MTFDELQRRCSNDSTMIQHRSNSNRHPSIPMYRIRITHENGPIRHIAYFSDESCAMRCFSCMQNYYNLFITYQPKITFQPILWFTTENGAGYSNDGSYVSCINDLYTRACACDVFLQRKGCRDVDVIVHMFGEKPEEKLGGVLQRLFASNNTYKTTPYTIR